MGRRRDRLTMSVPNIPNIPRRGHPPRGEPKPKPVSKAGHRQREIVGNAIVRHVRKIGVDQARRLVAANLPSMRGDPFWRIYQQERFTELSPDMMNKLAEALRLNPLVICASEILHTGVMVDCKYDGRPVPQGAAA